MNWTGTSGHGTQLRVNVPDRDALLADLEARLQAGQGFSVATLNLDHVVKLRRDGAFCQAYGAQTHVTADGNPIVWLSRLAGQSDIRLIPGSESILPVAAMAARLGMPLGLFGATDASLQAAAEGLKSACPGSEIALTLAPPMGFDPDGTAADEAIAAIGASGARIVFLALGAPKQERFAARAQEMLPHVGFLSIGAGLDFISGAQIRAPRLVQALALEWLWRMLGNPRRLFTRYMVCIAILPSLVLRALQARMQKV